MDVLSGCSLIDYQRREQGGTPILETPRDCVHYLGHHFFVVLVSPYQLKMLEYPCFFCPTLSEGWTTDGAL
jgi:hypothetical protein